MIEVKVRRVGNSLGIVLPKEITTRLRTGDGESLFLVESSNGYQLTSYDPEFAKQMKLAEEGMKKYRNTLRALAK